MPRDKYQTVREVAERLAVNEATVRHWIREGALRAVDIGKGWRIGDRDLETFLHEHENRPPGPTGSGKADNGKEK